LADRSRVAPDQPVFPPLHRDRALHPVFQFRLSSRHLSERDVFVQRGNLFVVGCFIDDPFEKERFSAESVRPVAVKKTYFASATLRFTVLETKGLHLKGSENTAYKERLFELLTLHSRTAVSAGELKLGFEQQHIRFELPLENNWHDRIKSSLS
jgi:hypothetical protein